MQVGLLESTYIILVREEEYEKNVKRSGDQNWRWKLILPLLKVFYDVFEVCVSNVIK